MFSFHFREPLWWIWLANFIWLVLAGDKYDAIRRGDVRMAAWTASTRTQTCREMREHR